MQQRFSSRSSQGTSVNLTSSVLNDNNRLHIRECWWPPHITMFTKIVKTIFTGVCITLAANEYLCIIPPSHVRPLLPKIFSRPLAVSEGRWTCSILYSTQKKNAAREVQQASMLRKNYLRKSKERKSKESKRSQYKSPRQLSAIRSQQEMHHWEYILMLYTRRKGRSATMYKCMTFKWSHTSGTIFHK